jgi:hypothetical protein
MAGSSTTGFEATAVGSLRISDGGEASFRGDVGGRIEPLADRRWTGSGGCVWPGWSPTEDDEASCSALTARLDEAVLVFGRLTALEPGVVDRLRLPPPVAAASAATLLAADDRRVEREGPAAASTPAGPGEPRSRVSSGASSSERSERVETWLRGEDKGDEPAGICGARREREGGEDEVMVEEEEEQGGACRPAGDGDSDRVLPPSVLPPAARLKVKAGIELMYPNGQCCLMYLSPAPEACHPSEELTPTISARALDARPSSPAPAAVAGRRRRTLATVTSPPSSPGSLLRSLSFPPL